MYAYRRNLTEHLKKHTGKTTCPLCQQAFAMVANMRRHMVNTHGLARDEVDRITNKRIAYAGSAVAPVGSSVSATAPAPASSASSRPVSSAAAAAGSSSAAFVFTPAPSSSPEAYSAAEEGNAGVVTVSSASVNSRDVLF